MNKNAVVVSKGDVKKELELLKKGQDYDDSRKIRTHDEKSIEIPIHGSGGEMKNRVIINQKNPQIRAKGLKDLLRDRGVSEEEIKMSPRSWDVIGEIALVQFSEKCTTEKEIGECLMELQGVNTVLSRVGIEGTERKPIIKYIAGLEETKTVHTEWGVRYSLDLSEVMFSPGNREERKRMGRIVDRGECVLDMFAGIGYFSIPMSISGAEVTAVEKNVVSMRYLKENIQLNHVEENLYPIRNDCRDFIEGWVDEKGKLFDRIVMGHYDSIKFLKEAYSVVKQGGIIHLHEVRADTNPSQSYGEIKTVAAEVGRVAKIENRRRIKGYSPGTSHFVVDIRVK